MRRTSLTDVIVNLTPFHVLFLLGKSYFDGSNVNSAPSIKKKNAALKRRCYSHRYCMSAENRQDVFVGQPMKVYLHMLARLRVR